MHDALYYCSHLPPAVAGVSPGTKCFSPLTSSSHLLPSPILPSPSSCRGGGLTQNKVRDQAANLACLPVLALAPARAGLAADVTLAPRHCPRVNEGTASPPHPLRRSRPSSSRSGRPPPLPGCKRSVASPDERRLPRPARPSGVPCECLPERKRRRGTRRPFSVQSCLGFTWSPPPPLHTYTHARNAYALVDIYFNIYDACTPGVTRSRL